MELYAVIINDEAEQGLANYSLWATSAYILNKVWWEQPALFIYVLSMVPFWATAAEFSSLTEIVWLFYLYVSYCLLMFIQVLSLPMEGHHIVGFYGDNILWWL